MCFTGVGMWPLSCPSHVPFMSLSFNMNTYVNTMITIVNDDFHSAVAIPARRLLAFVHLHLSLQIGVIPRDKPSYINKQCVRIVIYCCSFNFYDRKPCILLTTVEGLLTMASIAKLLTSQEFQSQRKDIFSGTQSAFVNLF